MLHVAGTGEGEKYLPLRLLHVQLTTAVILRVSRRVSFHLNISICRLEGEGRGRGRGRGSGVGVGREWEGSGEGMRREGKSSGQGGESEGEGLKPTWLTVC